MNKETKNNSMLLRVEDVAAECCVSSRTVKRWIANDGLPVHRIPGSGSRGILRVDRQSLGRWLGQYQHNFAAEEKTHDQKIHLEGRRFIKPGKSAAKPENRLDSGHDPASRGVDGRRK